MPGGNENAAVNISERINAIINRTTPEGRKLNRILQDARLPKAGEAGAASSIAEKEPADIAGLAQIYDYIFGDGEGEQIDLFRFMSTQNGQAEGKTPEETYQEQYKGPEKTPQDKLLFKKAMVVSALADAGELSVTLNGEACPGLDEAAHGVDSDEMMRNAAREELMNGNFNFSGVQIPGCSNVSLDCDVNEIRVTLAEMVSNIEQNDRSMIRSSENFRTMKRNLLALNKLVNEEWNKKIMADPSQPITFDMMNDFLEKSDGLRRDIHKYLDAKQKQVFKDPSRRLSSETYEQRRIKANIDNLESLNKMTRAVETGVLKGISGKARDYFQRDLKNLEAERMDMTPDQKGAFKLNVYRTLNRSTAFSDDFYQRRTVGGRETLRQARERILRGIDRAFSEKQLEGLGKTAYYTDLFLPKVYLDFKVQGINQPNADLAESYNKDYIGFLNKQSPVADADQFAVDSYRYAMLARDKKTLLENNKKNATHVPASNLIRVEAVDNIYGFNPVFHESYLQKGSKLTDEQKNYLKPIQNTFREILRSDQPIDGADAPLSEKDFAAIAFAGAKQQEAYDMMPGRVKLREQLMSGELTQKEYDTRLAVANDGNTPEEARLTNVTRYTDALVNDRGELDDITMKNYFPCIRKGKELAVDALKEYQNGNLVPLAKIIASGLTDIVKIEMILVEQVGSAVNGEMAKRLCNILERDDALKEEAFRQGLDPEDLDRVNGISVSGMLENRYMHACLVFETYSDQLSESQMAMVKADIYISYLLHDYTNDNERNVIMKDPRAIADIKEAQKQFDYVRDHPDEFTVKETKLADIRYHNVENIMKIRYAHRNELKEALAEPGKYEALRKNVVKMMNETEFKYVKDYKTFKQIYSNLHNVKHDTNKSSTFSYLRDYKKQPKDENGFYVFKDYYTVRDKTFEEKKNAEKYQKELNAAQKNQVVHGDRYSGLI